MSVTQVTVSALCLYLSCVCHMVVVHYNLQVSKSTMCLYENIAGLQHSSHFVKLDQLVCLSLSVCLQMGTQTVDVLRIKTGVMAVQVWACFICMLDADFPHHFCILIFSLIQNGCADILQDYLSILIHVTNYRCFMFCQFYICFCSKENVLYCFM